jgi:hypothetical protein
VGSAYGPHGSEGAPSPRAAFVTWQPQTPALDLLQFLMLLYSMLGAYIELIWKHYSE